MTALIPPPPPTVPLGRTKDGRPVYIDNAWALYLNHGILARLGGINGPSITEVSSSTHAAFFEESYVDEVVFVPGQTGEHGAPGRDGLMIIEEVGAEPDFIYPPGSDVVSGRYTPTLTNVANLDASTARECQYMRYGGVVMVSGRVDVDPTAAAVVQLGMSLPIPSNFSSNWQCAGSAASAGVAGLSAAIVGDTANDRAELTFTAVDTANRALFFTYMYWIQ